MSSQREVLVIVGAGGMGVSVARRSGGGRVIVLADVSEAQLERAAEQLVVDGHHIVTRRVDVTSQSSVAELADFAGSCGRLTHVVHTAGLSPLQGSVEAVLAVDLLGVALTLDEFGKVIEPGGAGVVISSMAAHFYPPMDPDLERQLATAPTNELLKLQACAPSVITSSQQAYPFAKRANQLRVAAAAGIWGQRGARINAISPGIISTAMGRQELDGDSGQMMRAMVDSSGTGRIGTPDDIAAATDFLLSPAASFITGIDLLVDGGVVAAVRTGGLALTGADSSP
ncbi:SDR family oxidoreductase [Mycolicibacterium moriokaense]|uniref:SDR family oxidoreductase n=1 Tax=Mycolicibacterium moriokaense TaxID=39691 RepID=UPI002351D5E4|nr:SDR family oxidoreductase [Mycolicibacterium moriokaense]